MVICTCRSGVEYLPCTTLDQIHQLRAVFHGDRPKLSLVDQSCHQPSKFKIHQSVLCCFAVWLGFCIVLQFLRWVVLQLGALELFNMCEYYARNCQVSTVHKLANGSDHADSNLIIVNLPYTYVALAWFIGVSIKLPVNWELLPTSVTWVGFEVCRALIYSHMARN